MMPSLVSDVLARTASLARPVRGATGLALALVPVLLGHAPGRAAGPMPPAQPARAAQQALAQLLSGNRRFAAQQSRRPNQSRARRLVIAGKQTPVAAVLCCS